MPNLVIRPLEADEPTLAALARLLIETVAHNGSVSFLHPLSEAQARAFWSGSLAAAARGERIVIGAFLDGALKGTVTLLVNSPQNQAHRAEIAKMMTAFEARGRGIGGRLIAEAERLAAARGKTLINLDTATRDGASGFYENNGYAFAGEIPDFALTPLGEMSATRIYWKRLKPLVASGDCGQRPASAAGNAVGEGDMGLFDSIENALKSPLGEMLESSAAAMLPGILAKTNLGDLQGVVNQLQQAGLGEHVQAWINGTEAPSLTPDMLQAALGSPQLQELAQHFGVDASEIGALLAQHLPTAVAHAAENGEVSAPAN